MAYDRLIAICCPLRYHCIVTKKAVAAILLFAWTFLLSCIGFMVGLLDRLSFCRSLAISNIFCDHGLVYRLACNDTSLNFIVAVILVFILVVFPLILIAVTYLCISIALSRVASREERQRALKTCISHLILVAVFFLPLVGTNLAVVTSYIHPNARIINTTMTHTIPAMVNPIVYSLKTDEVVNAVKKLCRRNRLNKKATK